MRFADLKAGRVTSAASIERSARDELRNVARAPASNFVLVLDR
jgi:hypothetical protein